MLSIKYTVCKMQAHSDRCTICTKWIHKLCIGVGGNLSLVVSGFRFKQCDGTIQKYDLAVHLVVDGEIIYIIVNCAPSVVVVCHDQVRRQVGQGFRCRDS